MSPSKETWLIPLKLDQQTLVFPLDVVIEFVWLENLKVALRGAPWLKGFMAYKGQEIPIIDLRIKLKMKERSSVKDQLVLVTKIGDCVVGLCVDQVKSPFLSLSSPSPLQSKNFPETGDCRSLLNFSAFKRRWSSDKNGEYD